ncbi:hypothetical protein BDFG_06882 [Blastomyces dermatitidis ATCC 26199]|nr:hypothetical protein BDFG_06882 [Blastomyces dermatitidis ATCC 26199]
MSLNFAHHSTWIRSWSTSTAPSPLDHCTRSHFGCLSGLLLSTVHTKESFNSYISASREQRISKDRMQPRYNLEESKEVVPSKGNRRNGPIFVSHNGFNSGRLLAPSSTIQSIRQRLRTTLLLRI